MSYQSFETPFEVLAGVERLVRIYESLTPATLDSLLACYTPDAHFKDPFNDVHGTAAIRQIFTHMFTAVDSPKFAVKEMLIQGHKAFLEWEFQFGMRSRTQFIRGVTVLKLNSDGQVLLHRDYWDSAEELYEKIPFLNLFVRMLRSAFTTPKKFFLINEIFCKLGIFSRVNN